MQRCAAPLTGVSGGVPLRLYSSRDAWREAAHTSGLAPFQRLAGTVGRWREEILNYWRFPLTNAFVEGKHNRVKVLKRRAYGYRNQTTFTLRILNLVHTD